MKRYKGISLISIMALLVILIPMHVFAQTLTLSLHTDKNEYNIGEAMEITVDWKENMQAAGFSIQYDESKIEFVKASIGDAFYNSDNPGIISVNWASMEEKDYQNMSFTFKTINPGECKIEILNPNAFANGNLESPTGYEYTTNGSKTIKILGSKAISGAQSDRTMASGKIPQTGLTITIIAITIAAIGFGLVQWKKYKNLPYMGGK